LNIVNLIVLIFNIMLTNGVLIFGFLFLWLLLIRLKNFTKKACFFDFLLNYRC